MITIIPSILTDSSAIFLDRFRMMHPICKKIHIDIMDGVFVPSYSMLAKEIALLLQNEDYLVDLEFHLMVKNPLTVIEDLQNISNVKSIIFHEAIDEDILQVLNRIHALGWDAGFCFTESVKSTYFSPQSLPEYFIVLTESKPGFSGTPFNSEALNIVPSLQELHSTMPIEADGGLNEETIPYCIKRGVSSFIVNSAIYKSNDPIRKFNELSSLS